MKKSYHSIVVPTVAAITALRSCAPCSESESPLGAAVLDMVSYPLRRPFFALAGRSEPVWTDSACPARRGAEFSCKPKALGDCGAAAAQPLGRRHIAPVRAVVAAGRRVCPGAFVACIRACRPRRAHHLSTNLPDVRP